MGVIVILIICVIISLFILCCLVECCCNSLCYLCRPTEKQQRNTRESRKKRAWQEKDARNKTTSVCFLLLILPFMPLVWLYHIIFTRRNRHLKSKAVDGCCLVRLPLPRAAEPVIKEKKVESEIGMSWYLHSYAACLKKCGLVKFNYTKKMSITQAIDRYVEGRYPEELDPKNSEAVHKKEWEKLLAGIKDNVFLYTIIEHLNRSEPKYYFRILPSGSVREGFGHPEPSTSILATDYDLMLVPDGVFVYDKYTEREDGFPASFTAIDDPNQNPERPKGFLWLQLEQDLSVWHNLCYERITANGVQYFLSQLAVLELIEFRLGSEVFLTRLNRMLNEGYANEDEEFQVGAERTGPALNVKIKKTSLKSQCGRIFHKDEMTSLDADFTLAISCPKFPRDGKYFFERRDQGAPIFWPNKDVIARMHELGCHVVPKPSSKQLSSFQKEQMVDSYLGSSAVLEWRYSFSQAEMLLADNIPPKARACYLAFKATIKTHINCSADAYGKQHKIQSYALKTILFYEIEKYPAEYWEEDDVKTTFFLALLASLREKVVYRFCPHYWIYMQNLFVEMDEKDRDFIILQLDRIKKEPEKFIADEWLEWNRMIRENCCPSCVDVGFNEVRVEPRQPINDNDSNACAVPIHKCACCCPYSGADFNPVAFEVY